MMAAPLSIAIAALFLPLGACVGPLPPPDPARRPAELFVDGRESSYPAFEAAAEACGYTDYWRFPGARFNNALSLGPHYNLFRVRRPAALCALKWVEDHPETGLYVSYH